MGNIPYNKSREETAGNLDHIYTEWPMPAEERVYDC